MSGVVSAAIEPYAKQSRETGAGLMVYTVDSGCIYKGHWFCTGPFDGMTERILRELKERVEDTSYEYGGICLWFTRAILLELSYVPKGEPPGVSFDFNTDLKPYLKGEPKYGQSIPSLLRPYLRGGIQWADWPEHGH